MFSVKSANAAATRRGGVQDRTFRPVTGENRGTSAAIFGVSWTHLVAPGGLLSCAMHIWGCTYPHCVLLFNKPQFWGGVNGRPASRVDQSGGPEHGSKEAKEGRCEA